MPTDPRAKIIARIVAPAPLPFVSHRAISRVRDWLPTPTTCPNCNTPVSLISNAEIYGREYGGWPYAYACADKSCYVGLHPGTDIPLGTLANKELREARKRAKASFFRAKEMMGWSRGAAYSWLAGKMGLPRSETHFGWFNEENCGNAQAHCEAFLAKLESKK